MPRSEFCTTASETNPSRRIHNDIRDSQFPESSQKTSAMHSERTAYIRSISKQQLVRSHISSRKLNPFFFSLLSLLGGDPTGVFFFPPATFSHRVARYIERHERSTRRQSDLTRIECGTGPFRRAVAGSIRAVFTWRRLCGPTAATVPMPAWLGLE